MTKPDKYAKEKKEFERLFMSTRARDYPEGTIKIDKGRFYGNVTVDEVWSWHVHSLEEQKKELIEEVIEVLWSSHIDETTEAGRELNSGLDYAISRVRNLSKLNKVKK